MTDAILRDAIAATGLPAHEIAGAVIIGDDVPTLAVPKLVLAPDRRDAGLVVMQWCVQRQLDPSRVAWLATAPGPATYAVEDVLWYHGHTLLAGTPPTDIVRAWADHCFERGRLHTALLAYLWIERSAPSPSLCTRIAIAWAKLGCPARGREWLKRCDVPGPQRRAALADFDAAARDARAHAERQLATNLAHLRGCFPEVAEAIASARTDDIELLWCFDVPWRLRVLGERFAVTRTELPFLLRREASGWHAVRAAEPPRSLRAQLDPRTPLPMMHACIGGVADYAALVNVVRNRVVSQLPSWKQSVDAIETDAGLLKKLAEHVDLTTLLRPESLASLRVGPEAERELVADFAAHPRRLPPGVRAACAAGVHAGFAALERSREQERDRTILALAHHYDSDATARVLAKLERGEPLRVWAWSSLHTTVLQHVARALVSGFRALGHTVELAIESEARERIGPADAVASLAAFEPDLAVLFDHTRPEYGPVLPAGLPVAAWILDELPALSDPRVLARLGALDLAFAWSEPLTKMYGGLGYPHVETLPFAVDTDVYRPDPTITAAPVVAYATHLAFPEDLPCAPGLYRALEEQMMAMAEVPAGVEPLRPLLDATIAALALDIPADKYADLAYQCMMIARHVDRVKVADAVLAAGLPIALFGRGWPKIDRFKAHHRGELAPGAALRKMYQEHAVVLHINTRCNLHPRVLECAASGGFVLARSDGDYDFAPGGVNEALTVGKELCLFTDEADMIAKIRRAFDEPQWREGFVQAGHDRVHAEHGYEARASAIVASLHQQLATLLRRAA
ncbi:MAG TPA: glycosyltransferase [Nannocystaceae bacterium]|nr:glycosyltransferase [Nannocystaceae bacterium]